jgi:CRISPR/Cas system type I-B associated protein Csh2 (Cas7 group RAMP superfamily)
MHVHSNTLVLDNGMWSIKTGFAGDEAPRHLERSLVGLCKNKTISQKIHHKEFYSSQYILKKKEILNIRSPVEMVDCSHVEKRLETQDQIDQRQISLKKEEAKKKGLLKSKDSKSTTKSLENVELSEVPGK